MDLKLLFIFCISLFHVPHIHQDSSFPMALKLFLYFPLPLYRVNSLLPYFWIAAIASKLVFLFLVSPLQYSLLLKLTFIVSLPSLEHSALSYCLFNKVQTLLCAFKNPYNVIPNYVLALTPITSCVYRHPTRFLFPSP